MPTVSCADGQAPRPGRAIWPWRRRAPAL